MEVNNPCILHRNILLKSVYKQYLLNHVRDLILEYLSAPSDIILSSSSEGISDKTLILTPCG